jgi:hypothetical protein
MFPFVSISVCSIEHTVAGLSWVAHPFGFLRLVTIKLCHSRTATRKDWVYFSRCLIGGTNNFMKFHVIGSNEEETRRREKQVAQVSTCAVLVLLVLLF